MTTRKVELCYYPVFNGGFKVPTNEELQRKIVVYFTHHLELKQHCGMLFHRITSTIDRTRKLRWYSSSLKHWTVQSLQEGYSSFVKRGKCTQKLH